MGKITEKPIAKHDEEDSECGDSCDDSDCGADDENITARMNLARGLLEKMDKENTPEHLAMRSSGETQLLIEDILKERYARIRAIDLEYYEKMAPLVEKRDADFAKMTEGWTVLLINNPSLHRLIDEHDVHILHSLKRINVKLGADRDSFVFTFGPNDYFTNETLTVSLGVTMPVDSEEDPDCKFATINWKPSKGPSAHPKSDDEDVEPLSHPFRFFRWLSGEIPDVSPIDVLSTIRKDICSNPCEALLELQADLMEAEGSDEELDDEEGEDDDEEGDDDEEEEEEE